MSVKSLLLGDIVPNQNSKFNINIDTSLLLFNLEAPILSKNSSPIPKAGPNLFSRSLILPEVNFDTKIVANLANNHIMDYGQEGLRNTEKECEKNNVLTVGAGENLIESRSAQIIEIENKKIGIIGCCEKQFGTSTNWNAGVSVVGPWIYSMIEELKEETDIITISIHGASEMSPWPSPHWQDLLRSFIDAGATIIHGHHSHIPQGFEEYKNGTIFYGLGNFVVDPKRWKNFSNTLWSITPEINLGKNQKYQIKTSILEKEENLVIVRESTPPEYDKHCAYLDICNNPLKDKKKLTAIWQEVSIRQYYLHYSRYLNFPESYYTQKGNQLNNRIKSVLTGFNEALNGKRKTSTQDELLLWYHLFACESHREAITTALGVISGELEDMRTKEICEIVDKMMPWSSRMI